MNQTAYVQLMPVQNPETAATYRSRVADMDHQSLWMEIPLDEKSRKYHRPRVGEQFRIFYFTQEGVKQLFTATVTGFLKDPVPLFSVAKPKPDQIERQQRRHFLRVDARLELALRVGDKVRFTALTEDIGGGGVSFHCDRRWPIVPGIGVNCWLLLQYRNGTLGHAKFDAEVVRVVPVEPDKHLVMMRYQDIQDSDQQRIIRYCFERQVDTHKK